MVLVSSASGPRVGSCIRAPRYFSPYPVSARAVWSKKQGTKNTNNNKQDTNKEDTNKHDNKQDNNTQEHEQTGRVVSNLLYGVRIGGQQQDNNKYLSGLSGQNDPTGSLPRWRALADMPTGQLLKAALRRSGKRMMDAALRKSQASWVVSNEATGPSSS
eukprot:scaffold53786_cov62-Phaeocystis_antarctica.AAC.2